MEAAPPEWYELPLISPWRSYGRHSYGKDQFGFIYMQIGIIRSDAITTSGNNLETVATLPVGFRPKEATFFAGIDTYTSLPLRICVNNTGEINVRGTIDGREWRTVNGFVVFPVD